LERSFLNRISVITILLLSLNVASAQKPYKDSSKVSLWLDVFGSPTYSKVKQTFPYNVVSGIPKLSYSYGEELSLFYNDRIGIYVGKFWSDRRFQTGTLYKIITDKYAPTRIDSFYYAYIYKYEDFPILLEYIINKNKLQLSIGGGISFNRYQKSINLRYSLQDTLLGRYTLYPGLSPYSYINGNFIVPSYKDYILYFKLQYSFSNRFKLLLTPTFRYGITPYYDGSTDLYFNSSGIAVGVSYKFFPFWH